MKKATLLLWVIIFAFIALLIFQNQSFFLTKNAHSLNFGIKQYSIPEIYNAVLVLIFFFAGLLIAYLFSLSARFKAKRTIKKLNTTIAANINEIDGLKSEVYKLKGNETPVDGQADTMVLDMNTSRKIAAQIDAESSADNESPADKESSADKTIKFGTDDADSDPGADSKENPEDETGEIRPK